MTVKHLWHNRTIWQIVLIEGSYFARTEVGEAFSGSFVQRSQDPASFARAYFGPRNKS